MLNLASGRRVRSTSALVLVLLVGGLLAPAASYAQPYRPAVATPPTYLPAAECDSGDTTGPGPAGTRSISGTVTNTAGTGIPEVRVRAQQVGVAPGTMPTSGDTTTTAGGEFVLSGLLDADYILSVHDAAGAYQSGFLGTSGLVLSKASAAPVGAGTNPADLVIALPDEVRSTISGRVTDAAGQPVAGIRVRANSGNFPIVGCGITAADGTYEMSDVRAGEYRIQVQDDSGAHPDGYYASTGSFTTRYNDATLVIVNADTANIDLQFPVTYSLSGTVTTRGARTVVRRRQRLYRNRRRKARLAGLTARILPADIDVLLLMPPPPSGRPRLPEHRVGR